MRDIIFFIIFIPFVFLALRHPFIGLCAWVWTVTAVPKNELFGFAADLRYTYFLALVTIVSMLINKDKFKQSPGSGLFTLMVIFLLHTAISNMMTLGSSNASWGVWTDFFKAIVFCGLVISLMTTKNRIHAFLYAYVFGIGFNITAEAFKFVATAGTYPFPGIKNSMMTDNNLFALAILMALPIAIYLISQASNRFFRLASLGISGAAIVAVIGSFSRGGFVGLIIVMWDSFWKSKYKFVMLFVGAIVLGGAISVSQSAWTDRMGTIDNATEDQSFMGRVTAWKLATLAAIENPVFGVGQDSMQHGHVWSSFYPDIGMFDFISTYNTAIDNPKAAHSVYFQVLGDAGFVGLLLFLLILYHGFKKARHLSKNASLDWIQNLSKAIKTSILAFSVSSGLLSLAYYDIIYMLIALLVCLERIDKSYKEQPSANI